MGSSYIKLHQEDKETSFARFSKDVFLGLMRTQKTLSSKYMYDEKGSQIYEKIMDLKEYYLVDAEYDCLEMSKQTLSKHLMDMPFNLIELGAGNGYKTKILIKHFLNEKIPFTYIPVDISEGAMRDLIESLNEEFPELETRGIVGDYFDALQYLESNRSGNWRNLILFLGSNIGNFTFDDAVDFIFSLWRSLKLYDFVLIGFDLRKDLKVMLDAYNDSKNVTAEFNLNVLERINRELGGDFDLSKFVHYEPYNVQTGAMESYLLSTEVQEVYISKFGRSFTFKKWEPIFMEHSYKYSIDDIKNLASITGFRVEELFYDSQNRFVDALWSVKPNTENNK